MGHSKGRVVFMIELKPGAQEAFRQAYEQIRYQVAHTVSGHLVDQLCRLRGDDGTWLITSEWESMEDFDRWERSPGHQDLVRPLRECIASARSLKFRVVEETGRASLASAATEVSR